VWSFGKLVDERDFDADERVRFQQCKSWSRSHSRRIDLEGGRHLQADQREAQTLES
jgi:hypothetical protein